VRWLPVCVRARYLRQVSQRVKKRAMKRLSLGKKKASAVNALKGAASSEPQQQSGAPASADVTFGPAAEAASNYTDPSGGDAAAVLAEANKENSRLSVESERLRAENEVLRGQVHMLKFKVELLVDMVTLANLDCDKLEDEVSPCRDPPSHRYRLLTRAPYVFVWQLEATTAAGGGQP
jgi:hypothetical protein